MNLRITLVTLFVYAQLFAQENSKNFNLDLLKRHSKS